VPAWRSRLRIAPTGGKSILQVPLPESRYRCLSMFVVVAFVGGVPVSIVDVVQMVAVEDGGVATPLTMHVDVLLGRLVHR
jgi:hypothetical protein